MPPKRQRLIACKACHKKKVKCSGDGPPCNNCKDSGTCVYPVKDHQVKIKQTYLNSLIQENERLVKAVAKSNAETPIQSVPSTPVTGVLDTAASATDSDRNPIVENDAWFVPLRSLDLPVHIGEAADAAFATRVRQVILAGGGVEHIPRTQYMDDDTLRSFAFDPAGWPPASQLTFLIDVALKIISGRYHIVRRSVVLESVDRLINSPASCDWITQCSLWALLAIGEVFSSRCTMPGRPFPGASYWSRAMNLIAISPERPRLEVIEIYLLLSFYASCLNRRHTCIMLASTAVRTCVLLGLHLEINQMQLQDVVLRQHRCRLWWTAYRFDRMWASRIGWPSSVPDDSIEIGYPSDDGLPPAFKSDFEDAGFLGACIRLARMHHAAVNSLYVRKRYPIAFVERVQAAVQSLRDWSDALPEHLKLDQGDSTSSHMLYLHLAFNQAVIVITRPILLASKQRTSTLSEMTVSLTTGCIRRARASIVMLRRAWADGTFNTFDYFTTQFLFSAATISGLSALLGGPEDDRQDFYLVHGFMHQLQQNGNFGAKEFCNHVDALKQLVDGVATVQPTQDVLLPDFLNDPDFDLTNIDLGNSVDWQDIFLPEPMV